MSDRPEPAHARSLAFLLSQVGAASAELFADHLTTIGLTPRQFAVLSHLSTPRSQQELSDRLGIHRNNMVALIDEMEAGGWVARHRGPTDRRVFEIRPTAKGRRDLAEANKVVAELDEGVAAPLTNAEREQLVTLIRRVADHLGLAPAVHPSVASRRRR